MYAWQSNLALEPVGMTAKELKKCYGMLCWDILEDGIVLEDSGVFAEVKAKFVRMKQEGLLERTKGGWKFSPSIYNELNKALV